MICQQAIVVGRKTKEDGPENFLIPNRFPGDPPWFLTVPPARFVAVLTDPRPAFSVVSHNNKENGPSIPPVKEKGLEAVTDCSPRQIPNQVILSFSQAEGCVGERGEGLRKETAP